MVGSDRRPTRRERERERHRLEILDAARKIMDARGLPGLTIEDVARETEFAVGSIYRHFRSKEELVDLLVVHVFEPLCEELEEIAGGDDPFEEKLDAAIGATLVHLRDDLPLLQAFHASGGGLPAPVSVVSERMQQARERVLAAVETIVVGGQREKVLLPGDPRRMTIVVMALLSGVHRWWTWGFGASTVEPAALVRTAFLDGFRRRTSRLPARRRVRQ
jgi:AcrR family transcriptional regulator